MLGLSAVGPAQPELISTTFRIERSRSETLRDGIVPALFGEVDAAQEVVRLGIIRIPAQTLVESRDSLICLARREQRVDIVAPCNRSSARQEEKKAKEE